MSDELEVRRQDPSYLATVPDEKLDGWIQIIRPLTQLATQVADTPFVPKGLRGQPEAAVAAMLFGRELGMPPLQALANVHMVEGKPTMSAEHLRAMVLAAGHEIEFPELTGVQVTIRGRRKGGSGWTVVTWNKAMVEQAGLGHKDNHRKYPRAMLVARASADLIRMIFADVTHGIRATEEVEDGEQQEAGSPAATPERVVSKVSRAKAKGTTQAAVTPASVPPVQEPAVTAPPRPPLPAAKMSAPESVAATPGEGLGDTGSQPPATDPRLEEPGCAVISNGQQCRLREGHVDRGVDHSFGGGMGDPVEARRCKIPEEHKAHAWNPEKDVWYACSGEGTYNGNDVVDPEFNTPLPEDYPEAVIVSEGDGSPDDMDATGGPVPDTSPTISPGALRALGAAFTSLGVKDSDERHHATSALLGRKVDTWKTLTRADADRLFKAVEGISTRDQLEALIQRAAEEWGQNNA